MPGSDLTVLKVFKLYSGNGTFMLLFAVSLIYLWIFEKDKIKKSVLVYMSLTIIVLISLPFFAFLVMDVFGEMGTYYRFIWLVPTSLASAYAIILFMDRFKQKWIKLSVLAVATVCILIGGVFMYENPSLYKAENAYEIPQVVIDICDDIIIKDREVCAVFPDEILQYPRLYSSFVVMPYGFEKLQFGDGRNRELHDIMVKDVIDVSEAAYYGDCCGVHYIIINSNKTLDDDFEDYGYVYVKSYGDYLMYKSTTQYFGAWEDYDEYLKNLEDSNEN